ncbi:MAG: DUF1579 domain-containing protein [Planctomycetales bacterium]|nr:DUF1579 domain-containing protein [Planctomycetales bacterium]
MALKLAFAALLGVAAAAAALALDGGAPRPARPDDFAKPGPHHEHLRRQVGTWDAEVWVRPGPDGEAQESRGVEVNRMACGGKWLVTDYRSEGLDPPFEGHGLLGFDPVRKRYVGVWADGFKPSYVPIEGTCDGTGRVLTMLAEDRDHDGKLARYKHVTEFEDDDRRTYTTAVVGEDGTETVVVRIRYRRRR